MNIKWTHLSIVFALILTFGLLGCGDTTTTTNNGTVTNAPDSAGDCIDCNGTYTLSGTVKDVYTGDALVGVTVSIAYDGKVFNTTTGATGQYSFAGVAPSTISSEDDYDEYFWSIERDEYGSIYVSSYWEVDDYVLEPYTVTISLPAGVDYNTAKTGVQAYPEYAWAKQVIGYRQRPVPVVLNTDATSDCADDTCSNITVEETLQYIFDPINDGSTQYLDFEIGQARASVVGMVHDFTDGTAIAGATVTIFDADGNNPSSSATPQPSESATRISLPTAQVVTDASGMFTLTSVPEEHSYFVIVQAAGYQMYTSDPFTVPGGGLTIDAIYAGTVGYDAFENNHAIKLIPIFEQHDLFPPYVVAVSPADCAMVTSASTSITIQFSEAMDTSLNGVTKQNVLYATGFIGGQEEDWDFDVPISAHLTWSMSTSTSGYDTLTIDPVDDLPGGFEFEVDLTSFAGANGIMDANGNEYVGWMDLDGDGLYDVDTSQSGESGGGTTSVGIPSGTFAEPHDRLMCDHDVGEPDGVLDFSVIGATAACTVGTPVARSDNYVDWGGSGSIDVDWPDVTGAYAYNVYLKWAGSPWVLFEEGEMSFQPVSRFSEDDFYDLVGDYFGDTNTPDDWVEWDEDYDFAGNTNSRWIVNTLGLKVAAVDINGDECGTSAEIVVGDTESPYVENIDNADCDSSGDLSFVDLHISKYVKYYPYYYINTGSLYRSPQCPTDTAMNIDLEFNEPLDAATVASANISYAKGWLPCVDQTTAPNVGPSPTLTLNFGHPTWPNELGDEDAYTELAIMMDDPFGIQSGDYLLVRFGDIAGNTIAANDIGDRVYFIDDIGPIAKDIQYDYLTDTITITLTEAVNSDTVANIVLVGSSMTITGRSLSVDGKTVTLTVDDLSLLADGDEVNLTASLLDLAPDCATASLDCDLVSMGDNGSPQSLDSTGTLVGAQFGVLLPWFPVYGSDGYGIANDGFIDMVPPRFEPSTAPAGVLLPNTTTGAITATPSFTLAVTFTEAMNAEGDPLSPLWATSVRNPANWSIVLSANGGVPYGLKSLAQNDGVPEITYAGGVATLTIHANPADNTVNFAGEPAAGDTVSVTGVTDVATNADSVWSPNAMDTSNGVTGRTLYLDSSDGHTIPQAITGPRNVLRYVTPATAATATAGAVAEGWHRYN